MKIIVCDDYQRIVNSLIRDIHEIKPDAECVGFTDPLEALDHIKENPADVALLDIDMPELDGMTLAKELIDRYPRINIIFVTGHPEFAMEAHELYASSFLVKPVTVDALKNAFAHLRYGVSELDEDSVTDFYNGKNHLGSNIRRLRTEKGLSVSQLAEKLDVKQQTIYRWESGERVPDIVRFIMLANLFSVETHELLK